MTEFVKSKPVKDSEGRRRWSQVHEYCQACGIGYREAEKRGSCLSTHHIIKPGRSDEPCNFLRLCMALCHPLAEGCSIRLNDCIVSPLTIGKCLRLKKLREPGEYNADRLAVLFRQALPPTGAPVPFALEELFRIRHPRRREMFDPLVPE